ncbi:MFS transporter [Mycobacterium paraterrae]|uniref:MFS transporter n=1 Tax=Mycobacterium paraterrae TaxID=577492 RepID=UPI003D9C8276
MSTPADDSWRALLGPRHLGTSTLLAGGVALYATNEFLTVSLLPSAIAEIGGERLFAWVTTLYLVGSVVAAASVNAILLRLGARWSFLWGLAVFGAGSLICAAAPGMGVMLVGRTLQGAAGGLLAGLGYALISTTLPRALWTRASALVSAMWGVATVIGPAAGGLFAQFGLWRWAFGAMAILSVAMAALVPLVLPAGHTRPDERSAGLKVPVWSVLLLSGAALTVSIAQIPTGVALTVMLLAASAILVVVFVLVDRRAAVKVLPLSMFGPGPLKWIYLALAVLMASAMVDMYVPLFGQRLAHLVPVVAGFLGAALAIGWAVSEFVSASLKSGKAVKRLVVAGPLVGAAGFVLAAVTQADHAPVGLVVTWAAALTVAGAGMGAGWPHLSAWAMQCADEREGAAAGAAINTIEMIAGAFGAGLAGVVVNSAEGDLVIAARALFAVFAVVGLLGAIASRRAARNVGTPP